MVGDGPDRSSAEWLANSKGIQNRVHFLGKQERVHELLPVADLMIMPSELESFGLAALEAMACKVPTIATRVGGVSELIDDGVTGRLFAVGDVDAMAAGAIELLATMPGSPPWAMPADELPRIATAPRASFPCTSSTTRECWRAPRSDPPAPARSAPSGISSVTRVPRPGRLKTSKRALLP